MHDWVHARVACRLGPGGRGERAAWLPLIFIGAMMFWTVALGLGGWSFMLVNERAMEWSPGPGADGDGDDARGRGGRRTSADPSGFPCRWKSLRNPRTWTTTPGRHIRARRRARSRRARALSRRPGAPDGLK